MTTHRTYGIRETLDGAQRLRQIVRVLFAAGFEQYVDAARLRYLVPVTSRFSRGWTPRRSVPVLPVEVRLRRAFEELGTTFVKLGQMLSMRPDLVGEAAATEFAKLQENVRPIPHADVLAAVETSLGRSWHAVFRSIAQKPLAAASVAQVHRAVTKQGKAIVLKVQRPGIRAEVMRDLHILALLARLLERYVPAARSYQPVEILRTFSAWTVRELDFTVEAGHVERFREDFAREPRMHVPAVHWAYTRPDLLALDEVTGTRITDAAGMRRAKIQRRKTAQFVMEAFLRQFFVTGFFHGDPHPGNLLATADGGIVLYDFGIMGFLHAHLRDDLVAVFQAYVRRDVDAYLRHVLDLSRLAPDADVGAFKNEVRTIMDGLLYRPTAHKGIPEAFWRIIVAGGSHGVRFPTDLVLFAKALITIEGVIRTLDPHMEIDAAMAPLFAQLEADRIDPRAWLPEAREHGLELARRLSQLPERTEALLKRVEEGRFSVRLDLDELKVLLDEFDRENDLRVLAVVSTGLLVAATMLIAYPEAFTGAALFGKVGLLGAGALLIAVFFQARRKPA